MSYLTVAWCTILLVLTGFLSNSLVNSREIQSLNSPNLFSHQFGQIYSENLVRTKRSNTQLKLCGNQLINMLGIMCRVYQNTRYNSKYEDGVEDLGHNSLRHSKHIFRKKRSLENYPSTIRHGLSSLVSSLPQGLSTRCCVSSCSMQQLMLAC